MNNLERIVAGLGEKVDRRFYGKYRGTVVDNEDPMLQGRLKVTVLGVLDGEVVTGWAMPCAPYGGAAGRGLLFVPEPRSRVWVEFEGGDLEYPIWVGTFWDRAGSGSGLPRPQQADGTDAAEAQDPPTRKIIKTAKGHTVQFEDADDAEAILIREGTRGHLVTLDRAGVRVTDEAGNTVALGADGIRIADATGSEIVLSDSAVRLTAAVDLTIEAPGRAVTIVGDTIDLRKG